MKFNWVTVYVKYLGIYFGHNKTECKRLNIERQLLKSENNEFLKEKKHNVGRIMQFKTLIIPNMTYAASVTNIDKENII